MVSRPWVVLRVVFNVTSRMMRGLARRRRITSERRRKAVLIAINYNAPSEHGIGELMFPQRDMKEVRRLLKETFRFQDGDIITLTDDVAEIDAGRSLLPTRANIMQQVEEFIVRGQDNMDYVFFSKDSGHSHQDREPTGGIRVEEDGLREFLLPVDAKVDHENEYLPESVIYDTYLHDKIIVALEQTKGSRLFALFDACHSCTLLNLKHYRCNRVGTVSSAVRRAVRHYIVEDILVPLRDRFFSHPPEEEEKCNGFCPRLPNSSQKSITICMSACKDSEMALEVNNSRTLTSAIVELLEAEPKSSLKDVMHTARCVVDEVRQAAKRDDYYSKRWTSYTNFKRVMEDLSRWNPQLSSNDPLDTNTTLIYSDIHCRDRHGRVKRPVWKRLRRLNPIKKLPKIPLPTRASFRRG